MEWGKETGGGHPPSPTQLPREAQTYRVSFSKNFSRLQCLVAGCLGGEPIWSNLQTHFAHHHVWDVIVILK